MSGKKTHRLVKEPKISAKDLAEFMDASETAKRTIIRACKFRSIGRITQHKDAKLSISKFIRSGSSDTSPLLDAVYTLRSRLADSDFDRDLYDHNADYIERFADVQHLITMPDGEILSSDAFVPLVLNGVAVNPDLQFRLRRLTKTNKVKVGGGMLRYAKGKALDAEVAAWQSAFLFGYLTRNAIGTDEAEHKLCLTIDGYSGVAHSAPTDATKRFNYMISACATISERWPNIQPPPNAIF